MLPKRLTEAEHEELAGLLLQAKANLTKAAPIIWQTYGVTDKAGKMIEFDGSLYKALYRLILAMDDHWCNEDHGTNSPYLRYSGNEDKHD